MGPINIFKPLSTFLEPVLLINLSNIDHFSSEKASEKLGIKPGVAGWEAIMLPLCYAAPHDRRNFFYVTFHSDCLKFVARFKQQPTAIGIFANRQHPTESAIFCKANICCEEKNDNSFVFLQNLCFVNLLWTWNENEWKMFIAKILLNSTSEIRALKKVRFHL